MLMFSLLMLRIFEPRHTILLRNWHLMFDLCIEFLVYWCEIKGTAESCVLLNASLFISQMVGYGIKLPRQLKKRRLRTNLQELVMWLIYWFGKYELTHSLIWWNRTQCKNYFQLSVSDHSAFRLPDPSMQNILLKYETRSNVDSMCPRRHLVFMKANNWCVQCATEQHVMPRASQSLNEQWMLWSLWQRRIFISFRFV